MLVIAHRGANKEAFENSWTAFEKAVEAGSQRIELDVQITADGHLAILHDDSLRHCTGHHGHISKMTRASLEKLTLRNSEPIPFLDEFLKRFLHRVEVNIEIKPDSMEVSEKVMEELSSYDYRERVIISSFRADPLIYLADNHPEVKIACLWGDYVKWRQASYFAPLNFMQRCRTKIFHPWTRYLNAKVMDQAKARGWIVYPYVGMKEEDKNREDLWIYLASLGIDGLCTNYPREFARWVQENCGHEKQRHPKT